MFIANRRGPVSSVRSGIDLVSRNIAPLRGLVNDCGLDTINIAPLRGCEEYLGLFPSKAENCFSFSPTFNYTHFLLRYRSSIANLELNSHYSCSRFTPAQRHSYSASGRTPMKLITVLLAF